MTSPTQYRRVLKADALLGLASGLPALLAPAWLASVLLPNQQALFGWPMATVVFEIGLLLVAYAGILGFVGAQQRVPVAFFVTTAVADAAWVGGTLVLLAAFGEAFSIVGAVILLLGAAAVAAMGLWKLVTLRRVAGPLAAA